MTLTPRPLIICGLVLLALGVRFLTWQDNRSDIGNVQTSVTDGYKDSARQLAGGDLKLFASDLNHMGHPPGYPILLAAIFKTFGDSNTAIQFIQILLDTVAVVLLFLIALHFLPVAPAMLAGFLAAISPQFAYFSVVLLPDSLVVPPILLAIWFLIPAKTTRLANFAIAGALIGVSCLLRANALLLPFFLALLTPLFVTRGKRLHAAAALLGGSLLVIAPVTIKNAIVFRSFIPLSLGAGQTFLEGIADYDDNKRFNIPITDLGLMRQEAEWSGNPEYAQLLFGRDGIERDGLRIVRGLDVVRDHPFWFAGVVARRGVASTRLDPVPVLRPESPVSHQVPSFSVETQLLPLAAQHHNYAVLHVSETKTVSTNTDCVAYMPVRLAHGRLQIKITDEKQKANLASTNVDLVEGVPASQQPVHHLALPFVSAHHSQVRLAIANLAAHDSVALIGTTRIVELGPSSHGWLRYVRRPLGFLQQFSKTAWVLPFAIIGLLLLVRKRDWQSFVILLAVPAYYLVVQSTLHTERRYVYIIHFFFLILVSEALWKIATRGYVLAAGFFATHKPETPNGRFV